jgi:hypothetical protein
MPKRRKKRGRPRTGRHQVIPVRLPPKIIKAVAKVSAALNLDRSKAVRWMLERSLCSGLVIGLLRSGRSRGLSGEIARAIMAEQKAAWAAENASSAAPAAKPQAEVTALRASEEASTSYNALSDRVALKRALKRDDLATDRVKVNRSGSRRLLTIAEINAAVARAEQRSKKANHSQSV